MSRADPDPVLPTSVHTPGVLRSRVSPAPADVLREAEGLASWLARQQGRSDEAGLRDLIASFLAGDISEERLHVDTGAVAGDLDDAEIFVEVKVSRFLRAVGLPVPHELAGTCAVLATISC